MASMSPGTTGRKACGLHNWDRTQPNAAAGLREVADRLRFDQAFRDEIVRATNVDSHDFTRAASLLDAEANAIDAAAADPTDPFDGLPTR